MALMAFGLSGAFKPRLRADRATSWLWLSSGFQMAFRWLSRLSVDRSIPTRPPSLLRSSPDLLLFLSCILHNSFKDVVVDVLIYTKITEVIENCRVMEFSGNKFDGPRSKVVDGCHEGLCQDERPMCAMCCVEQPKYDIYLHCSLDEQVSGWLSDGF